MVNLATLATVAIAVVITYECLVNELDVFAARQQFGRGLGPWNITRRDVLDGIVLAAGCGLVCNSCPSLSVAAQAAGAICDGTIGHDVRPITATFPPKRQMTEETIPMKAIVVTDQAAGTAGMKLVERPEPRAGINDVVVQVHASGFTSGELTWPSTW